MCVFLFSPSPSLSLYYPYFHPFILPPSFLYFSLSLPLHPFYPSLISPYFFHTTLPSPLRSLSLPSPIFFFGRVCLHMQRAKGRYSRSHARWERDRERGGGEGQREEERGTERGGRLEGEGRSGRGGFIWIDGCDNFLPCSLSPFLYLSLLLSFLSLVKMGLEYGKYGIRVLAVNPGTVREGRGEREGGGKGREKGRRMERRRDVKRGQERDYVYTTLSFSHFFLASSLPPSPSPSLSLLLDSHSSRGRACAGHEDSGTIGWGEG